MELLNPGQGLVFWMVLTFGLLLFLLRRFAWKPILRAIKQREERIEDALKLTEVTRAEMEQLQFDNKVLFNQAKEERDAILREARSLKESIIEEARIRAGEEAERIIASAKDSIHFEKLAAITELKNQLAQMSIDIAEKVLEHELSDPEKQRALIEREMVNIHF